MAALDLDLRPIDTVAGVQPITEKTNVSTRHYTYSDKIRFKNGIARKIAGWVLQTFDYSATISGTVRTIFSDVINGLYYTVYGTNSNLYSAIGSSLTNITPLQTISVAAANSLDTHYATLGANPIGTTIGSNMVTITDSESSLLKVGDYVTISGVAGTIGGVPNTDINGTKLIRMVSGSAITIYVTTTATSTATGGGGAVVRTSGLLTLTKATHGLLDGQRVGVSGATDTGGILAAEINKEFIIRNVTTNTFDFMAATAATSSVTAAGGASTVYFEQIAAGNLDETNGFGYGAGLYGAGLYGTSRSSGSGRVYPRIWFVDRYSDIMVMTAGNQTGVYQWDGNTANAPVLVTNAPTEVNYAFVSNNTLVTLGAEGIENRIFASDFGDITNWTSSSTNTVYDDDIEGATRLISHCPTANTNLIFTEFKTYTFRFIGSPDVWEILPLDETIGIISPMARVSAGGNAFWMGQENFYTYRGGNVEVVRANSQTESTLLRYVFDNINYGQKSKCFAWYNKQNNEVWFHYPSAGSNECDSVAVVNILDFTWAPHTFDRTAAEYPNIKHKTPRLADVSNIYQHETGLNADNLPMEWTLTGDKRFYGKNNILLKAIVPDSVQDGTVHFNNSGYLYPQSQLKTANIDIDVTQETERVPVLSQARIYQYTWSGEDLDQNFIMGNWMEEVQSGAPR